jgi:undecaprenyl phosphate N,N'-diacetylbacillosamine 1-phosphate transferase
MYRVVKRLLDLVFAVALLAVLWPLFAIIALAIKLDSRGPALFRQQRLGLAGRVFHICKFRSMVIGAEKTGSGVYSYSGDSRVTRVGGLLCPCGKAA